MDKVLIYGAGHLASRILETLPALSERIAFFIDRNENIGAKNGIPVLPPEALCQPELAALPVVIAVKGQETSLREELCRTFELSRERFLLLGDCLAAALEDPAITLRPVRARLDICTLCQLDCAGCFMRRNPRSTIGAGQISCRTFRDFLEKNPFLRALELSNSGEPLLNRELIPILELAAEKGVETSFSNGVNFNTASDALLEALVRCGVRRMTISLDGASQSSYGAYRRGGNFDRVIGHIRRLNEIKGRLGSSYPRLTWQFILMAEDEEDAAAAADLARELEMDIVFKLDYRGGFQPKDPETLRRITGLELLDRGTYDSSRGEEYDSRYCSQLLLEPQINWDGRLLGCCTTFAADWGCNVFEEGLLPCVNRREYRRTLAALLRGQPLPEGSPCAACITGRFNSRAGRRMLL